MDCEQKIEQFFSSKKVKEFDKYELDASGKFIKNRDSSTQNSIQRNF